jgi:hypothetical protein
MDEEVGVGTEAEWEVKVRAVVAAKEGMRHGVDVCYRQWDHCQLN